MSRAERGAVLGSVVFGLVFAGGMGVALYQAGPAIVGESATLWAQLAQVAVLAALFVWLVRSVNKMTLDNALRDERQKGQMRDLKDEIFRDVEKDVELIRTEMGHVDGVVKDLSRYVKGDERREGLLEILKRDADRRHEIMGKLHAVDIKLMTLGKMLGAVARHAGATLDPDDLKVVHTAIRFGRDPDTPTRF